MVGVHDHQQHCCWFSYHWYYPVNRDAIQLPGQCDFADKCIEPIVEYTPFKRYPQNTVHTSSSLKAAKSFTISRPSALRDIADIKTPEFKTKRIKAPEEQVVTSSVFPDPPANVYGIRGGADKAIKCKYNYIFFVYSSFLPPCRCVCRVFCLQNENNCHIQALWAFCTL